MRIDQKNAPAVTIATARGLPKVVVDRVDDHLTAMVWYLGGRSRMNQGHRDTKLDLVLSGQDRSVGGLVRTEALVSFDDNADAHAVHQQHPTTCGWLRVIHTRIANTIAMPSRHHQTALIARSPSP